MPNWRLWSGALSRKRSIKEARYDDVEKGYKTQCPADTTCRAATTPTTPYAKNGRARAIYLTKGASRFLFKNLGAGKTKSSRTKPKNIFQIESPVNATAWQDQKGSKLYLENLDLLGSADPELKGTLYSNVRSLVLRSKYPNLNLLPPNPLNPPPDTIYVTSAGGSDQRMAAKKMVLGLLDFYKLPNKPILKETLTNTIGSNQSAIEFSVKGITQIVPIMTKVDLSYSKPRRPPPGWDDSPEGRTYQAKFEADGALRDYQASLTAGVVIGFRVEKGDTPEEKAMFQEIKTAAESLQKKIGIAITTIKETTPDSPDFATLEELQKQVGSAIDNNFTNELDARRWQQWLTLNPKQWHMPKPRTEDEIVPGTKEEIGAGIQGAVFKYQLVPPSGGNPSEMILKYDSSGLNENAKGAGIPDLNPQQSVRAVAAYKMSQQLNLGLIPRTEVFVGTDDDDGRPKLGFWLTFRDSARNVVE